MSENTEVQPKPISFGGLFEFIKDPKKCIKEFSANPPHSLGLVVLLLVCLELVLNRRLIEDLGTGPSAISQFISVLFLILFAEAVFITTAHKLGRVFYKKGNPRLVWTFCNLSLWPLLLILPVGLIIWTSGLSSSLNLIVFIFLLFKIVKDWKIIVDRHYQFNRWQSALIMLALGGMVYAVVPIIFLFSFLGTLTDFISLFR